MNITGYRGFRRASVIAVLIVLLILSSCASAVIKSTSRDPFNGKGWDDGSSRDSYKAKDQPAQGLYARGNQAQTIALTGISSYKEVYMRLLYGKYKLTAVTPGRDLNSRHFVIQLMAPIIFELLIPLYVLIIIITGIYYTWGSISPNIRAQVRSQLLKLLVGIVACGLSLIIFDMLLAMNNLVVRWIIVASGIIPPDWDPITGFATVGLPGVFVGGSALALILVLTQGFGVALIWPIVCLLMALIILPFIVLALRFDVLLVFGMIMPFTMFCQSFDYLKGMGTKLMKITLTWIFMPVPMAVFMVLSKAFIDSSTSFATFVTNAIAALAAFCLIGISPMMLGGMLGAAGASFVYVGQTMGNPRLIFVGSVIQGQSAAAFTAAAFHAERLESRTQGPRDSAAAYNLPSTAAGAPTSAANAQPPAPYSEAYRKAARETGGGAGEMPLVLNTGFGDGARTGVTGGVFDYGIGFKEGVNRAFFDPAVLAGTTDPRFMSAKQQYGIKFTNATTGFGKAYWASRGLLSNVSPKRLMAPAGYFLRGMLRQTIGDWPIGKSLTAASNKMTGWWATDPATGQDVFNYGWQSYRGVSRDLATSAAESYKGFTSGSGTPPAFRNALTGAGIALPLALFALPIAPAIGIGIVAVAAGSLGLGTMVLKPVGEKIISDRGAKAGIKDNSQQFKGIQDHLLKQGPALDRDGVWGSLDAGQKKAFGYNEDDPSTVEKAKGKAFSFYNNSKADADTVWNGFSRSQKKRFGWRRGMADGDPKMAESKQKALAFHRESAIAWASVPEERRKSFGWSPGMEDQAASGKASSQSSVNSAMYRANRYYKRQGEAPKVPSAGFDGLDPRIQALYTGGQEAAPLETIEIRKKGLEKAVKDRNDGEDAGEKRFNSASDLEKEKAGAKGKQWSELTDQQKGQFGYNHAEHDKAVGDAQKALEAARDERASITGAGATRHGAVGAIFNRLDWDTQDAYLGQASDKMAANQNEEADARKKFGDRKDPAWAKLSQSQTAEVAGKEWSDLSDDQKKLFGYDHTKYDLRNGAYTRKDVEDYARFLAFQDAMDSNWEYEAPLQQDHMRRKAWDGLDDTSRKQRLAEAAAAPSEKLQNLWDNSNQYYKDNLLKQTGGDEQKAKEQAFAMNSALEGLGEPERKKAEEQAKQETLFATMNSSWAAEDHVWNSASKSERRRALDDNGGDTHFSRRSLFQDKTDETWKTLKSDKDRDKVFFALLQKQSDSRGELAASPMVQYMLMDDDARRNILVGGVNDKGSYAYEKRKDEVSQELDGGKGYILDDSKRIPTIVEQREDGTGGKSYSIERDGVYVSDNQWGGGRSRVQTRAEKDAVTDWYYKNQGNAARHGTTSARMGDVELDEKRVNRIMEDFGDKGAKKGMMSAIRSHAPWRGSLDLESLAYRQGIIERWPEGKAPKNATEKAEQELAKTYKDMFAQNRRELGEEIRLALSYGDRAEFADNPDAIAKYFMLRWGSRKTPPQEPKEDK